MNNHHLSVSLLACALCFTAVMTAQEKKEIQVFQSVKDAPEMLRSVGQVTLAPDDRSEMDLVSVYPEVKYQTILGFGGAITEAAAYNFMQLSPAERTHLSQQLFSPDKGIGLNFCRTHIGSADFSVDDYTYVKDGDESLQSFSIDRDRKYILPMVKSALRDNAKLLLFASPWSPPGWMKDNATRMQGGKLLPKYYPLWARYFAKYLKAYSQEGIRFFAVTVQNEPNATQSWESCRFTGREEALFAVKNLRPTLDKSGLREVKIMIWDHNKERLLERASESFAVPGADKAIWGIGYHWYTGTHFDALQMTHDKFPQKPLVLTEFCCGMSSASEAGNTWQEAESYATEIMGDLNHYATAITDWNLLLDLKGGPYHNRTGGCTAPVIVDASHDAYKLQPIYYAMGHFSKFIHRGAVRLGSSSCDDDLLHVAAFRNPDGQTVVVLLNRANRNLSPSLRMSGATAHLQLPAKSLTTLVIP